MGQAQEKSRFNPDKWISNIRNWIAENGPCKESDVIAAMMFKMPFHTLHRHYDGNRNTMIKDGLYRLKLSKSVNEKDGKLTAKASFSSPLYMRIYMAVYDSPKPLNKKEITKIVGGNEISVSTYCFRLVRDGSFKKINDAGIAKYVATDTKPTKKVGSSQRRDFMSIPQGIA